MAPVPQNPKLGVLGGMGPLATVDFMQKLVAATPAKSDQDHIPTILYSAPHIPDRTESIRGSGPSPLPYMRAGIGVLEQSGASCIAIPCNTAHYWYEQLTESSRVEIFHIADAACDRIARNVAPGSHIGLLATAGTLMSQVYQHRIEMRGYRYLEPNDNEIDVFVMPAIYLIKAGRVGEATPLLEKAQERLHQRGAKKIILGCTEIPIALPPTRSPEHLVDATQALAETCVDWWIKSRESKVQRYNTEAAGVA